MAEISKKNAVEIEKSGKLDEIIDFLIDCKRNGKSVFVTFNGNKLYSADITDDLNADKVYIIACGLTQKEHEAETLDNSSCLPKFTGKESALDKQKAMEESNKKLEEIQQKYAQLRQKHIMEQKKTSIKVDRSFDSLNAAIKFLIASRNNGEFVYVEFMGFKLYSADVGYDSTNLEAVKKRFEGQIPTQKSNATKASLPPLPKHMKPTPMYILNCLQSYRDKGKSVYIVYEGKTFYSDDATLDSIHLLLYGLTRDEYEQFFIETNDNDKEWRAGKESAEQYTNNRDYKAKMKENEKKYQDKKKQIEEKYAAKRKEHIKKQKESATHISRTFDSFDEAIKFLIACRDKGESISIDFEGIKLFSADVGHDTLGEKAQEEIKTRFKQQIDRQKAEQNIAQKREKKSALKEEIGLVGTAIAHVRSKLAAIKSMLHGNRNPNNPTKDTHEDIE